MSSVGDIRQALADAIEPLGRDFGLVAYPYIMNSPTAPCAMVYQGETTFDLSFGRGLDGRPMTIRVIVPFTEEQAAQSYLDEFRDGSGPRSFKQALEADKTLGGACRDLQVVSASQDTVYGNTQGQPLGIGCEFQLQIFASGI